MFCCVCSSQYQNCSKCFCKRSLQPCRGCRKGDACRNPYGNHPRQRQDGNVAPPLPANAPQRNGDAERRQENERGGEEAEQEDDPMEQGIPENGQQNDIGREEIVLQNAARRQEADQPMTWMGLEGEVAENWVNETHLEVASWSSYNIFEPPICAATKDMIKEQTSLINNYNVDSILAPIALKIPFLMPHLLCQKTHEKAKHAENVAALTRRMAMWQRGEVNELLSEARALQERIRNRTKTQKRAEDTARQFGDKMRAGQVSAATRSLTEEARNGILPITQETMQLLKEKHPHENDSEGIRFQGNYNPVNAVIFERITGEMVWKKAVETTGGAGPSGLNADGWRVLLSTAKCKDAAVGLRNAIATLARKLATSPCQNTQALVANRLIPLKKQPNGCRPIGVGEVMRRIIGKCIMEVVKDDVKTAVGNLQVCAGQRAGGEAAIHAMRQIFAQPDCEAVMLVDATNAFNSINRKATIHNTKIKCPSLAQYLENTYSEPVNLHVVTNTNRQEDTIKSREGTTQGDPVAMAMYALGLSALQSEIRFEITDIKQVAYADDLTGAGKIEKLKEWWDKIVALGPQVGYHPNARKSFLIVKPEHYEHAVQTFNGTDVIVTKEGQRHLGAVIGTEDFKIQYVTEKVAEWVKEIKMLSDIAKTEPHAAYTAFTHGVKHRWNYLMRTIPNVSQQMRPLETAIKDSFIKVLTKGRPLTPEERSILALPSRMGGLLIINLEETAAVEHRNSTRLTAALTERIILQNAEEEIDREEQQRIRRTIEKERQQMQQTVLQQLTPFLSVNTDMKRKLAIAQEVGASNWLTSLPIRAKGFSLNKQEFTDALALRYGWPVEGLPERCICGADYDLNHAMICKTGGFISMRHDEVRDLTVKMLKEVCVDVTSEPSLLRLEGEQLQYLTANTSPEARVDLSARGFWIRGQRAYCDIRIFDPMARCYKRKTLLDAHKKNEDEKLRAYGERIQQVDQGSFTPLVFTTSGGMGPMAKRFYARLAETLAEKKQQPKSYIVAWMRCRLSFSLLRSALICLRGTRSSIPRQITVANFDYEAAVIESRIDMRLN